MSFEKISWVGKITLMYWKIENQYLNQIILFFTQIEIFFPREKCKQEVENCAIFEVQLLLIAMVYFYSSKWTKISWVLTLVTFMKKFPYAYYSLGNPDVPNHFVNITFERSLMKTTHKNGNLHKQPIAYVYHK